jgi:hypothetical protein
MKTHADKTQENQTVSHSAVQKQGSGPSFGFVDNRPEGIAQLKLQEIAGNSPQVRQTAQLQAMANDRSARQQAIQRKENNTGLPDDLKSGIEQLSGYSLDDVNVHYNSDQPAKLQAHAYAQGTDIHLASGQEKHLPHEAWHVVQQKQGRVKPTLQLKENVPVNDDDALEKEADVRSQQALQLANSGSAATVQKKAVSPVPMSRPPVQRAALGSIGQPAANLASAIVPDLPATLVTKIQNANTTDLRTEVLKELLGHLKTQGALDTDKTRIRYLPQISGNAAVTEIMGGRDNSTIRITVYQNGFDAGPADLYSTVRHELIHVGQRHLAPDETVSSAADGFIHENIYDTGVGTPTTGSIQLQMQEIETHSWEIIHRAETGIQAAYLNQTVTDMTNYAQQLINAIPGLPISTFMYWRPYLDKAAGYLTAAYNSHADAVIQTREQALTAAIAARATGANANNGTVGYGAGLAAAEATQQAANAEPDYMAGFDEYNAGMAQAQSGQPNKRGGQHAYFTAYTQYNNGLARAQNGQGNDQPNQQAYTLGFDQYTAGLARAQSGQGNDHANQHAYKTAHVQYMAGLTRAQRSLPNNHLTQHAFTKGYDQYLAGITRAQGGHANDHPDQHAYTTGYDQYLAGMTRAQGGQGNNRPTHLAYTTGHTQYQAGYARAQGGLGNDHADQHAYTAGFNAYIPPPVQQGAKKQRIV